MSLAEPDIDRMAIEARAARHHFRASWSILLGRLNPQRLREDAAVAATQQLDGARQALRRSVARHPVLLWSLAATLLALFFWKPANTVARRLRVRWAQWRQHDDQL